MNKRFFFYIIFLGGLFLTGINAFATSIQVVHIKKENAGLSQDISYPQGFGPDIDKSIQAFIKDTQANYLKFYGVSSSQEPAGESSLYVIYEIKYDNQEKGLLSLWFTLSTYVKGAAHPNNTLHTLNFMKGQPLSLVQLFKSDYPYLKHLSEKSRKALLLKEKSFDPKWVAEGTQPKPKNFENWYFTDNGLALVFDTYQVAAYVYGPQVVMIPKKEIENGLKPLFLTEIGSKAHEKS